jgi:hypothetical protein
MNHGDITTSANTFKLVGGNKKTCDILTDVGQHVKHQYPQTDGEEMVKLAYDLKQLNRFNCPSHLNPQIATFNDVKCHAILRQRKQDTTIEKHLRYARFMENHIVPVDFRNPSYENFFRHMDYREQLEKASPNGLAHEWKAMEMFLWAYMEYRMGRVPIGITNHQQHNDHVKEFYHYQI